MFVSSGPAFRAPLIHVKLAISRDRPWAAAILRTTYIKTDHCFPGQFSAVQTRTCLCGAGPGPQQDPVVAFLHVNRATISLKLVLRPTDEWQEPGIVTTNDYYYPENRAWEELARANTMKNTHIHPTSFSHSHFSFSLFRGFKDLYVPTPPVVPQNLRRASPLQHHHIFLHSFSLSPPCSTTEFATCTTKKKKVSKRLI